MYRLYKSLVVSILLYGRETWAFHVDIERRMQTCENNVSASPIRSTRPTSASGTWMQQLLVHKSPYWRSSNEECWLGLDTSPGTILCARLFSRAC
ncbi:hypothetical protein DPMN_082275 [Dreissena polymorpha]|uniref:Uncharacterized protein n=1 Tax=Dreissena polymorpha TaxID=45954 RepID=A0A9D3YAM0_DREPO|nr:hypothetical protein DPMN_082275 [Dreissena polymorpha]